MDAALILLVLAFSFFLFAAGWGMVQIVKDVLR